MSAAQAARQDIRDRAGKYAEGRLADAGSDVLTLERDWGQVDIGEGSRTPWGEAQQVDVPAAGIAVAYTAGHGGLKLSTERNKVIPAPLRNSSGWYEEDVESHIVAWVHPEAFAHSHNGDLEAIAEGAKQSVIRWFPDKYEAATGETIPFGVSAAKDEATYNREHDGQRCLYSQGAAEHPDYPGMVVVTTDQIPRNRGHFSRHMIPLADYQAADANRSYGAGTVLPLLPASAIEVPEIDDKPAPRPAVTGVSTDGMTANQAARAKADLAKLWRDSDGRVFTLGEDIAAGRYCGKAVHYNNSGQAEYSLRNTGAESRLRPVSKAIWDAYAAPDERTPADLALAKYRSKQAAADRAYHSNWDRAKAAKLAGEAEALYADYERLSQSERDAKAPAREAAQAAAAAADKQALDAAYAQAKARGLI